MHHSTCRLPSCSNTSPSDKWNTVCKSGTRNNTPIWIKIKKGKFEHRPRWSFYDMLICAPVKKCSKAPVPREFLDVPMRVYDMGKIRSRRIESSRDQTSRPRPASLICTATCVPSYSRKIRIMFYQSIINNVSWDSMLITVLWIKIWLGAFGGQLVETLSRVVHPFGRFWNVIAFLGPSEIH